MEFLRQFLWNNNAVWMETLFHIKVSTEAIQSQKKNKKWGCKLFMICSGSLGIIHYPDLFTGKGSFMVKPNFHQCLKRDHVGYKLAFDSWFSLDLINHEKYTL